MCKDRFRAKLNRICEDEQVHAVCIQNQVYLKNYDMTVNKLYVYIHIMSHAQLANLIGKQVNRLTWLQVKLVCQTNYELSNKMRFI